MNAATEHLAEKAEWSKRLHKNSSMWDLDFEESKHKNREEYLSSSYTGNMHLKSLKNIFYKPGETNTIVWQEKKFFFDVGLVSEENKGSLENKEAMYSV